MFLSYEKSYIEPEYKYTYKLIDSDFIEEFSSEIGREGYFVRFITLLIDVYEKRNLNVASNIMKAIIFHHKTQCNNADITVLEIVGWNKRYNTKFSKYEKELEKYLCLI